MSPRNANTSLLLDLIAYNNRPNSSSQFRTINFETLLSQLSLVVESRVHENALLEFIIRGSYCVFIQKCQYAFKLKESSTIRGSAALNLYFMDVKIAQIIFYICTRNSVVSKNYIQTIGFVL